jgi:cell division protein FtsA
MRRSTMARGRRSDLIVTIDVGTDSVRCVIAEKNEFGAIEVIGVGRAQCTGLKRGVVINIDATVSALRAAVEAAELMSGREVSEALVNITGSHIGGRNLSGVVAVRHTEVRTEDVARVLRAASEIRIDEGRDTVHVLPVEYAVDDIHGLQSPLGIAGVRLEAKVHLITAAKTAMENLATCCMREGIKISGLIFSPLAASEALLHEDERELGVILADIGAGVTDFVVWYNGGVIQTGIVNIGGKTLSDDIAVALRTPRGEAEALKLKFGCAMTQMVPEDETIEIPGVGGRKAETRKRAFLAEIMEPCLEEIFTSIGEQIQRAGHKEHVSSGLVLTGGCSRIKGIAELGELILGIPVRCAEGMKAGPSFGGVTNAVEDPTYTVALGMVKMAARGVPMAPKATRTAAADESFWKRFKIWLKEAFVS